MNPRIFHTKKRLEFAINHPEKFPGMQEYLDSRFAHLFFDLDGGREKDALDGKLFEIPYWIEKYQNQQEDSIFMAQYIPGYHEPLKYGDEEVFDEITYRYVDSQSLDEEEEHQAEDGKCVYEYRGYSFLRIWKRV